MRLCKAMQDTYKHADMKHLEQKLQEHQDRRARMIITDGVFSMDGDLAPLDQICDLATSTTRWCSWTTRTGRVHGKTGRGVHEHFASSAHRRDHHHAGQGARRRERGCVSGRREIVELCRQRARPYLFSNAVAPPIAYGALKVLEILSESTERRDTLEANTTFWRQALPAPASSSRRVTAPSYR